MTSGPSLPPTPIYTPPAYTAAAPYSAPQPYVSAPNPQSVVPNVATPTDIMNQGAQVESLLPQNLQIANFVPDQNLVNQYANNYYQQNIAPQIAQQQAALFANGQGYGSYGGALLGQMASQGQLDKFNAGLTQAQQQYQNALQGNAAYLAGGPALAQQQNQSNVSRGLGVSQIQTSQAANQNNYDLSSAQMANQYNLGTAQMANSFNLGASGNQNNFNLSNYQNALNASLMNQQLSNQQAFGLGSLGLGVANLATGGLLGLANLGSGSSSGTLPSIGSSFNTGTPLSSSGFGGLIGNYGSNQVGSFGTGSSALGAGDLAIS